MYSSTLNTKRYWQELNAIAKNAKQQIISINNTVQAIQKFNKELSEISKIPKRLTI